MLRGFGAEIDEGLLRDQLRREQAEDAYELLREIARSGVPVTAESLDRVWHERYR